MIRKTVIAIAALAVASFALAACGSDDSDTTAAEETTTTEAETTTDESAGGGAGGTISVSADADGALAYTSGDLSVDSGSVKIDFDNPSSVPHDVQAEDPDGNTVGGTSIISGSSESVTLDLPPGDYLYYCSVGGHRAAGMEQSLTVK